ncbi:hypothetical protein pipiens_011560 [Culex pipiens pipiens]|uniref:Uncharacterized protein n=1 Tax=Culex pipiens pipiens TaxID=38569 RepID=A0ABD1D7B2_CULPP
MSFDTKTLDDRGSIYEYLSCSMEQLKPNLVKVGLSGSNIDLEQSVQPEPSHFWQDLEHFIRNTHWAWLVVLASLLLLFAFLVAGFVLATVVLLVTFYLFIGEQNHIESLEYS